MLLNELQTYCDLISLDSKVEKKCIHIFLSPYYLYIEKHVRTILSGINADFAERYSEDIAFQIVSYAYENYFTYVYPFEYQLAQQNDLFQETRHSDGSNDFICKISCSKDWVNYLFNKYPILYDIIELFSKQILEYIAELISNFNQDADVLTKIYGVDKSELKSICLFKGDLHNGRCVSSLSFRNGTSIYYKPRRADNETFLQFFIEDLNTSGLNVNLGIPKFVNRNNYSWHLHILDEDSDVLDLSMYYYN